MKFHHALLTGALAVIGPFIVAVFFLGQHAGEQTARNSQILSPAKIPKTKTDRRPPVVDGEKASQIMLLSNPGDPLLIYAENGRFPRELGS